jgi:predicted N-formylglutamate amidohydrolase
VEPEAVEKHVHFEPGMDARSTRVAERLKTPMLIAAR